METNENYIRIENLEVYQLSRELSRIAWEIFDQLSFEDKKNMGNQFLSATDSVGANIVEGYHRYHFLDKIKFYYYSRASLMESQIHWLSLLFEIERIKKGTFDRSHDLSSRLEVKLNNFISATYKQIKKSKDESK